MTDKTYTEAMAEVGKEVAELRGEVTTGLTKLEGAIANLTTIVEAGNAARIAETAELRKDVDDHEKRLRAQESRKTIAPWQLWTVFGTSLGLVIAAAGVVVNAIK